MAEARQATLFGEPISDEKTALKTLLTYVLHGKQAQAEQMIAANPSLLYKKLLVSDLSGRKIEGTALGAALGADDVRYHADEECMVEMIKKHLRNQADGEAVIAAQIAEQFPSGYEEKERREAEEDFAALRKVCDVIASVRNDPARLERDLETDFKAFFEADADAAEPDTELEAAQRAACNAALAEFRKYLQQKSKHVITTGKHFNMQLFVEAFRFCYLNYSNFGGCESHLNKIDQNRLAWQVLGTIERYFPAHYAQAFAQWIDRIIDHGEKLNRSFEFRDSLTRKKPFFPLESTPRRGFGYEDACVGTGIHNRTSQPSATEWVFLKIEHYIQQKTAVSREMILSSVSHLADDLERRSAP